MAEATEQKRVIVNADDLGFSPGVNEGIIRAHREGILTSTTLAANMPAAADGIARLADAPGLGVGVHLNVSQGRPLSKEGRALAGDDGMMNRSAMAVIRDCMLRPRLLAAIRAEMDAQIRWAIDHGVRPTHLDTHRHSHAFAPIFRCVSQLARHYNIRFVRWYREALPGRDWPAAPSKQRRTSLLLNCLGACNALIGRDLRGTHGTWGIEHTGLIDAAWLTRAAERMPPGVTEIMTHPGARDDLGEGVSRLRQSRLAELAALCDAAVKEAFKHYGIELTHYGRL